jgi:VanZ family protein
MLVQYDAQEIWIPGHHGVVAEKGTRDWEPHLDVFDLDPNAVHIDLVIQQAGIEGSAEFDRLVAEPVQLRPSFRWWQMLFAGTWVSMGVLYFRRCRLHRRKLRVLILLNAVAIIAGTMMPARWIEDTSRNARNEVVSVIEKAPRHLDSKTAAAPAGRTDTEQIINQFSAKIGGLHAFGHFTLFASLCFLIYLSAALEGQSRSYFFKVAFDVLLFAGVTESLQYLTLDRMPGFDDWVLDLYGMAVAFICFLAVLLLLRLVPGRRMRA